jgi:flagellar protein FlaG
MVSEINKLAAGGAGVAAMRSNTPAPDFSIKPNQAVQVPEVPKVQAPKPVAIHFDPMEVRQNLKEAVTILNQQASESNRGLGFRMDETLGHAVVTVISANTGEVVRQIPNEVVVRVAHNIARMKGIFFNSQA